MNSTQIFTPSGDVWKGQGTAIWEQDAIGGGLTATTNQINALLPPINFIRYYVEPDGPTVSEPASNLTGLVNNVTNNGNGPIVLLFSLIGSPPGDVAWFTDLVNNFGSNPYVWYDPLNEPPDGGTLVAAYTSVISAIRAKSNAPILIQPAGNAPDWPQNGTDDSLMTSSPNLVWDMHFYANATGGTSDQTAVDGYILNGGGGSYGVNTLKAHGNVPVVIGEFGNGGTGGEDSNDTGAAQVLIGVETAVNNGTIAGCNIWEFHASGGISDSLTPNGGDLTSLVGYGQGYLSWLNTGTPSGDVSDT